MGQTSMACSPFSDWGGVYLGLEPLRELPAGFFMWIRKGKIWQKAKRDLQEAPTLGSILLVVTIHWSENFPIQPTAHNSQIGLCEFFS